MLSDHWLNKDEIISKKIVYYEGTSLNQQGILNVWEIIVSAWERKIEFIFASLTLDARDLRALEWIAQTWLCLVTTDWKCGGRPCKVEPYTPS